MTWRSPVQIDLDVAFRLFLSTIASSKNWRKMPRFEPMTYWLQGMCSTTLLQHLISNIHSFFRWISYGNILGQIFWVEGFQPFLDFSFCHPTHILSFSPLHHNAHPRPINGIDALWKKCMISVVRLYANSEKVWWCGSEQLDACTYWPNGLKTKNQRLPWSPN